MKKLLTILIFGLILACVRTADAGPTWNTGGKTLYHYKAYAWNLAYTLTPGEEIVGAILAFDDLKDDSYTDNDRIFIHLLDDHVGSSLGWVVAGTDTNADSTTLASDFFAGQGKLIDTYNPPDGGTYDKAYNLISLGLKSDLTNYLADSKFSFGIDPDCHYSVSDISLELTTRIIPAPGAIVLGGIGVGLVGWLRRRRTL